MLQRIIALILVSCFAIDGLLAQATPQWKLVLEEGHPYFGALLWSNPDRALLRALQAQEAAADQLKQGIKVFANPIDTSDFSKHTGMLGTYRLTDSTLHFIPRFPFIEGQHYQILTDGPTLCQLAKWKAPAKTLASLEVASITIPRSKDLPPAKVSGVYPSSSQVPANLLKCYIQFAQPMSLASVYPHIRLLDETGEAVPAPFLELTPELWDPQHQRLTLWLDPGRIKSHLIPNQQMGAPLQAGRVYTLLVDSTFKDAHGQFLEAPFHKTFFTTAPDRQKPAILHWDIIPPVSASRAPLVLLFPEPMDIGVLESSIAVVDSIGHFVTGAIQIDNAEKSWLFTPEEPWPPGKYQLRISKDLEDLAGNNLERLFDREIVAEEEQEAIEERPEQNYIQLDLEIQ